MRIAILNPCLTRKSAGGSETYLLGLADILSQNNDVTIFTLGNITPGFRIKNIYKKYGYGTFKTKYIFYLPVGLKHPILRVASSFWLRYVTSYINNRYDLFINDNKTMVVAPKKPKSIHIIHFPEEPLVRSIDCELTRNFDTDYLPSYSAVVPNSEFTNFWLKKYWGIDGTMVLNPIVNVEPINIETINVKENIIIAVDRLVPDKKIKEMIYAFSKLIESGITDYKFVIIGNEDEKYRSYKEEIIGQIHSLPVEVRIGISNEDLMKYYKRSKIFWHAKGYEVADDNPRNMEHFGMTTVEAMANGCVPVVIDKGGQREIVEHGVEGYRWNTIDELVNYTKTIIEDDELMYRHQVASIKKSVIYSKDQFSKKLDILIKSLK